MKRLAIHSVPRSGSTWLGALLDAHPAVLYKYQPLFSYELKGRLNEQSTLSEIDSFFEDLSRTKSGFLDQESQKSSGIVPRFHKENVSVLAYKEVRYHHVLSNLLANDSSIKIIGLVRDPRAVLYSWWKAPKEFNAEEWEFGEEWLEANKKNARKPENFYGYKKWKETAEKFIKLSDCYPDNFYLLDFADLLKNTEEKVKDIMSFSGLSLNSQQSKFIANSKSKHIENAYSVFKVKYRDDKWKNQLPNEIVSFIESDLKGSILEKYIV